MERVVRGSEKWETGSESRQALLWIMELKEEMLVKTFIDYSLKSICRKTLAQAQTSTYNQEHAFYSQLQASHNTKRSYAYRDSRSVYSTGIKK